MAQQTGRFLMRVIKKRIDSLRCKKPIAAVERIALSVFPVGRCGDHHTQFIGHYCGEIAVDVRHSDRRQGAVIKRGHLRHGFQRRVPGRYRPADG